MEWLFLLDTIRCEVGLVIVCIAAVSCWDLLLLLNSCGTHWIFSKPYFAYLAMQIKAIFGKVLLRIHIQYTYREVWHKKNSACISMYNVHTYIVHRRLTISIKMLGYWIYMINGNGRKEYCLSTFFTELGCEAALFKWCSLYFTKATKQTTSMTKKLFRNPFQIIIHKSGLISKSHSEKFINAGDFTK